MRYNLMIIFVVLFAVNIAAADEIYLNNGDRLTGKVVQLNDGKLTFASELAGEVTLNASDIKTISTAEPVEVHLSDGTSFSRKLLKSTDGQFSIDTDNVLAAQKFDLANVASFNPPKKEAPKWTGSISAGFVSTHGNTKNESINASLDMHKRTEKDRTTISGLFIRSEQEDPATGNMNKTEDNWRVKGKYDYFFNEKMYGYVDGRYEKDSIAQLDRRVIVGLGGGYQWIESDVANFSTEGGIASLYERFDNQTDSNTELSAQFGYHYDRKLNGKVTFINDLTYYPAFGKPSDYLLTTTAELRASITDTVYTSFRTIFDYDTTPAAGSGSTDLKYIFGVGMDF
ncbi:MAG: DUF481 domain-containing protein [Anaerohalosphaera sp.]|nr:DUF481 domain-containing protein [Anaerohalosphaera sp.]